MNKICWVLITLTVSLLASCSDESPKSEDQVGIKYLPVGGGSSCEGPCPTISICVLAKGTDTVGIYTVVERVDPYEVDECTNPFTMHASALVMRSKYPLVGDEYNRDITVLEPYGFNTGAAQPGSEWIVSIYNDGERYMSLNWIQVETSSQEPDGQAVEGIEGIEGFPTTLGELREELSLLRANNCNSSEDIDETKKRVFDQITRSECK